MVGTTPARLLVVVAHPDDETFGCGGTLLWAAERGAATAVCCATRGEEGVAAPGSGVTRDGLAAAREHELRAAASFLGVERVELLGFRDSGMAGEPVAAALVSTPLDAVAATVARVIDDVRPHVVVTLDASDGHRDHAHIRDATLAAVALASWHVQAVYLQCLLRSLMQRWIAHTTGGNPDSAHLQGDTAALGTPDEAVTTDLDTAAFLDRRRAAIALHASQTSPFVGLPEPLSRAFLSAEHLQRVVPPWDGDGVEHNIPALETTSGSVAD